MKKILKKIISTMLILAMVVVSMTNGITKQVYAAVNQEELITNYLNCSVKYLYLGEQGAKSYDFNIKKEAKEEGATYTWYVKTNKGNLDSVTIDKATGIVTAKEAGTAFIRCKISLAGGKILRPEARVTVRNNIKEVVMNNLPENSTILAGITYDFNRSVLNTNAGKGVKTEDITRWEISDDAADVEAATNQGVVFPIKEGKFKIRAVCFQSEGKYNAWIADKVANKVYITAASEWATITVDSANGIAAASTQEQLDKLLAAYNIDLITLCTENALKFVIPKGNYIGKTLIVNTPNADVENHGVFKKITISAIKDNTWIEYADGNIVYLSDEVASFVIDKDVRVKQIVIDREDSRLNIEINGTVDQIIVLQPAEVNFSGSGGQVPVIVETTAGGSAITSSMPLNLGLKAKTDITLNQGAEDTILDKSERNIVVKIENDTKKDLLISTNNIGGEAIGSGKTIISKGTENLLPILTTPIVVHQSSAKIITATTMGTLTGGNITTVPAGTKVSALKLGLTVSASATAEILTGAGGTAVTNQATTDVTATMVIRVTAQDLTTAEYTITMGSSAKIITATAVGTLTGGNITTLPAGTKVSDLKSGLTVSASATAEILTGAGGTAISNQATTDVTATMVIRVTAQDLTTAEYTITMGSSAKIITATTMGTLTGGNITTVPAGTKASAIKLGLTVSASATAEILTGAGGTAVTNQATTDVTATMVIRVTAQDLTTAEYTITMGSSAKIITATAVGTLTAGNITTVPAGTKVSDLKSGLTVSASATEEILTGAGGTAVTNQATTDVTATMVIRVTAQDLTTAEYTITMGSSAKIITATAVGTLTAGNITTVPAGTKVSALKSGLTVSASATAEILTGAGGTAVTNQATTDVTATMVIRVTAQDLTTVEYTITMGSSAKIITATTMGTLTGGNITTVPAGTKVSALKSGLTVSASGTPEILTGAGGTAVTNQATTDVTATMVIRVTAQDLTTAEYTISIAPTTAIVDVLFAASATQLTNTNVWLTVPVGMTAWFAPTGTAVGDLVIGVTMTRAVGGATKIFAPKMPGSYKLYLVDAANNIAEGTNILTVNAAQISAFDPISSVFAGTANNPTTYQILEEVGTHLPKSVSVYVGATSTTVSVPIWGWQDTDTYNPAIAASYTFTAVLGAIPTGYQYIGDSVTVEVVVGPEIFSTADGYYQYQVDGTNITITQYLKNDTIINIPGTIDEKTVTTIGNGAFRDKNLTNVTLPNSITSIGTSAFNNNNLTSISIPSNVTIDTFAFISNSITSITIGSGVTVGDSMLDGSGNNYFRIAYNLGHAGTYTKNLADGTWAK